MKQLIQLLRHSFCVIHPIKFFPYFEKENNFNRLVRIHSLIAFLFCPLFALLLYFTDVPSIYQYLSLSYTVLFPVYAYICKSTPVFRQKLLYFYFVHLFVISIISFFALYSLNYPREHLFYFSSIYTLTLFVTQRMVPVILYNLLVGAMMIIGFSLKIPQTFSIQPVFAFFILVASASILVLLSRERLIKSMEDYSDYLKQILNNPGTGFILFKSNRNNHELIDFNDRASDLLGKNKSEIKEIVNVFTPEEYQTIYDLTFGEYFTKTLDLIDQKKSIRHLELNTSIMQLKNGTYYLLRIHDITAKVREKEQEIRASLAEENNEILSLQVREKIQAQRLLKEQLIRMNTIFDQSANTMLAIISNQFEITICNTFFKHYFMHHANILIEEGMKLDHFLTNVFDHKYHQTFRQAIKQIKKGNPTQFETSLVVGNDEYHMEIYLNPIVNIEGSLLEISMVARDITQKKKQEVRISESLKEKELLLKEIHHRVKNNLQIISSIINLQAASIQDEQILEILRESKNRIYTMATIHENLYQSEQFSSIQFDYYLKKLVGNTLTSYKLPSLDITVHYHLDKVKLSLDQAIPCGLIVNELLTNVVKYAFIARDKGELTIELTELNGKIELIFADNGVGLPDYLNVEQTTTLGLQLVTTLINQLDGEFKLSTQKGTKFLITFDKTKL
jgi:two-component sensor histidine kinase/PAS domain-containing protein